MKKEKVVISFIAVLVGILVAALAFYLYQTTKVVPLPKSQTFSLTPKAQKPTPTSSIFLTLDTPKDEEVISIKTVIIAGKTTKDAVIIVTVSSADHVVTPAQDGSFSVSMVLENGANQIEVTAVAPNGEEATVLRTVTVSTESF